MRAVLAFAVTIAAMGCGRGGDGAEPGANGPTGDTPTTITATASVPADAPRVVLTASGGALVASIQP